MSIKVFYLNEKGLDKKDTSELNISDVNCDAKTIHEFNRYQANKDRVSHASTKTRSEINRSKRKLQNQKGSGKARKGTASSNILYGGAVAFGPRGERSFAFKMNRKVISNVIIKLFSTFQQLYVIKSESNFKKTKDALKVLSSLEYSNDKKLLVLCTPYDSQLLKPFSNLSNIIFDDITYLSPERLVTSNVVLTESAFVYLQGVSNE